MSFQGNINQAIGLVAGAKKIGQKESAGIDYSKLNAARSFEASNKSELESLQKAYRNKMNTKLTFKKDTWNEIDEAKVKNMEDKIALLSNMQKGVGSFLQGQYNKLAKQGEEK